MTLVDTSVWIDHFRRSDPMLEKRLAAHRVLIHPFVLGELALGSLKPRVQVLTALRQMPTAILASPEEVLELIERHALAASGIGYVDAHLLTSALLVPEGRLWTRDIRLAAIAIRLNIGETLH